MSGMIGMARVGASGVDTRAAPPASCPHATAQNAC